jgi:alkylated DNA repair dioxygenase AlkB
VVREAGEHLSRRYGVRFVTLGANLYRHGRDSVAWHGDRIARDLPSATIAIVSVGSPRPFRLRPRGGGAGLGFALGHGDLLVMGGSCQRTHQHTVPKVVDAGPRISLTFRHAYPTPA